MDSGLTKTLCGPMIENLGVGSRDIRGRHGNWASKTEGEVGGQSKSIGLDEITATYELFTCWSNAFTLH